MTDEMPGEVFATGGHQKSGVRHGLWDNDHTDTGGTSYTLTTIHTAALAAKDAEIAGLRRNLITETAEHAVQIQKNQELNAALRDMAGAMKEYTGNLPEGFPPEAQDAGYTARRILAKHAHLIGEGT